MEVESEIDTHTQLEDGPNTNSGGRLLAIGDIHGCIRPLDALLDSLQLQTSDTFVVLGDFVNRGPASRQVLERLVELTTQTRVVAILGNHEEEMLAARDDHLAFQRWLAMGGRVTLASYDHATSLDEIPRTHWQFVEQAVPWWECENYFFTHANYDHELAFSEQSALELRWLAVGDQPIKPHYSGKTAIVGHTPNLAGRVIDFGFLRCLDTGCGLGGRLTVMDVRTRQIWQCAETSDSVLWGTQPTT